MSELKITYSKSAVKSIKNLNEPMKSNIKKAIEKIPDGDIKKLKGYTSIYRLRSGNYRVIYKTVIDGIFIEDILPRGEAYKRL